MIIVILIEMPKMRGHACHDAASDAQDASRC